MREVLLSGRVAAGRVALVDDEDHDFVSRFIWHVQEIKRRGAHSVRMAGPYAATAVKRDDGSWTKRFMHSLITGWPKVDHVNHDGLDNQRHNLRPTDASLNAMNQRLRTDGSSSYKGVYWCARTLKWAAHVKVGSKRKRQYFESEIEAALAYDRMASEFYGKHAYLNFPEGPGIM